MNFGSTLNNFNKDIKESTAIEVLLKEIKLGSLKNSFHAS